MDKVVITGGSGLLGRALLARLAGDAELTVISRSETPQLPLRRMYPSVRFLLGDVRDRRFLATAFAGQDAVIHAAALKHVDLSEREPTEYVSVNVEGSRLVVREARAAGARVVGISTDKACQPYNVYGLSKLLMERMFCEQGQIAVRYGNVFGSDGSVIPTWRAQLAASDQITVTDPEMTRFFFPVDAAVDEVIWALACAPAGCVVVPRLQAASLADLATAFLAQAGHGTLIVSGRRPGEKQHESLLSVEEGRRATEREGRVLVTSAPAASPLAPITSETAARLSVQELQQWIG